MKRSTFLSVALAGALEALACSPAEDQFRYDTLDAGAVRLVRTYNFGSYSNPKIMHDTMGVFRPADLEARLRGHLQDSALVFIGRFDSLSRDSVTAPSPLLALDTAAFSAGYTAYLRLQVDTVLRGVFPHPRPVWIKVREGFASCNIPFARYVGRSFLNASGGFSARSHLKVKFDPFEGPNPYATGVWPYPYANWFTGRYLYDPAFPKGLRLDITRILSTYPATAITPRRLPGRDFKAPPGKAWLPNGREAVPASGRNPVPAVR